MAKSRKEKGFILVILLSLLLLLAVTAMSLNFKLGMQARMAANRTVDAQTYLDQLAVIEQSLWKLTGDPSWRVPAGEDYAYQGRTYNRKVFGPDTATYPALAAYRDAVIVSVQSPNATRTVNKSFRYNISNPLPVTSLLPVIKPRQACADSVGNIYFADMDNHRVWKINVSGVVTPVAGTGASGYSGDSVLATNATLNSPQGVAVDSSGNIYIADTLNHRIRKVTTGTGIISTEVNKTGTPGSTGDGGKADVATLRSPQGIWVNALGDIYIADTGNHRIRVVRVADNRKIYLVAGTTQGFGGDGGLATNPAAKLDTPKGGWTDASGNIYIADTGNHRIRKVAVILGEYTGIINTFAGTGTAGYNGDGIDALSAQLNIPHSVWMDASGIYIADTGNHRIRKVTPGNIINTFAGTGNVIKSIDENRGDGGAAIDAKIDFPTGVCGTGQTVVVSETMMSCLRKVESGLISTWPPAMTAGFGLNKPQGITAYYDASGKKLFLFIADQNNHRIRRLDTETNAIVTVAGTGIVGSAGDDGPATNAQLNSPQSVFVAGGELYIADTNNNKIRKVTNPAAAVVGNISTIAGTGTAGYDGEGAAASKQLKKPRGISADGAGSIYIADTENNRIRKVTTAGAISTVVNTSGNQTDATHPLGDGGDATAATLNKPQGVFVDGVGNIYIADTENNRIRKVTTAGAISTVVNTSGNQTDATHPLGDGGDATAATLNKPQGVLVDGAGNIYIADTGNHVLWIVNIHNNPATIHTMAGVGLSSGYNCDYGPDCSVNCDNKPVCNDKPAVQAWLSSPGGVALGQTKGGGRIYIGDTGNNRVRVLFLKTVKEAYGP